MVVFVCVPAESVMVIEFPKIPEQIAVAVAPTVGAEPVVIVNVTDEPLTRDHVTVGDAGLLRVTTLVELVAWILAAVKAALLLIRFLRAVATVVVVSVP